MVELFEKEFRKILEQTGVKGIQVVNDTEDTNTEVKSNLLDTKNTFTHIKNTDKESFSNRMSKAETRISELNIVCPKTATDWKNWKRT